MAANDYVKLWIEDYKLLLEPYSIEIVVQGGSDEDVANIIWKNKAGGIRAYGKHYAYATDITVDDLKDLPEDCEMGSIARIITPPAIYRKNSAGKWILQFSSKGVS